MASEMHIGQEVLLQLGVEGNKYAPPGLKRWDECRFIISKKKAICGHNGFTYYELTACRSAKGIPYAVLGDWITPTR